MCNIQLPVLEHSGIHLGINHMGDDTHKFSGDKEHFVALSLNNICMQHEQETADAVQYQYHHKASSWPLYVCIYIYIYIYSVCVCVNISIFKTYVYAYMCIHVAIPVQRISCDNTSATFNILLVHYRMFHSPRAASFPWLQGSWGQHGAHLGPAGPRCAPC